MDLDRRAAYLILRDIHARDAYSNLAVNRQLGEAGIRSGAFVRELVYGVLRNQLFLDYNIDRLMRSPDSRLKAGVRILLRMGLYQLLWMDSVTDYAAVDETVKLAGRFHKGQTGFVNGVLRSFVRNEKRTMLPDPSEEAFHLSVRYSCHREIVDLWMKVYGSQGARDLLESVQAVPPLTLRTNNLKIGRPALMEALASEGLLPLEGLLTETAVLLAGGEILNGNLYREGYFSIQDESSQLAVQLLDPKPGERLLDLCAAPGGKSCAAAEWMKDEGEVDSFDVHADKIHRISREAGRLGITIVRAAAADGTVYEPSLESVADCVLVDAPCSGLGVVRRKPELKLHPFRDKADALHNIQRRLLDVAACYIKTGGRLLYSTCTINPDENERVTEAFLASHPGYSREKELQLLPSVHGTDGLYICLMRRQND